LYSLLIPSILSASFFLPIFILIDKGDLANWFVLVIIISGVFAFFVGLEGVFEKASRFNFYVFSKKERSLSFLPRKNDGGQDKNVFRAVFIFFNPISVLGWIAYGLFKLLKVVLHALPHSLRFLFHFSIRLEQLMRKELWSVTSLSSAIGVLYGHFSQGNLLVAGAVGGVAYLTIFGLTALVALFAKALPHRYWVEVGVLKE